MSDKRDSSNIVIRNRSLSVSYDYDQIHSKDEWLILSRTFTAQLGLVLVLTFKSSFPQSFHFKANRNSIGSSKKRFLGFSKQPSVSEIGINTLTLKQIFWKTKSFFKKLEYCVLVETTKIESTSFSSKIAPSEANVKINSMATTKWTYHKEWSFARNCFIFLESLFQFQNLLSRVNLMYNDPNIHNHIFRKHQSLILGCFFPVTILNHIQDGGRGEGAKRHPLSVFPL